MRAIDLNVLQRRCRQADNTIYKRVELTTYELAQLLAMAQERDEARADQLHAEQALRNAIRQAQQWKGEARTQHATVMDIGELIGCRRSWSMVSAVREALQKVKP